MKKELMIIVPNLQGGGQERIAALTTSILKNDYNITLVVFDDTNSKYQVSDETIFLNLNVPNSNSKFHKICNVVKRIRLLKVLKKQYKIDYCFSIGRSANIVNVLSKTHGKTIVSIRNSSYLETGHRTIINDFIYHRSEGVICISEGQKNRILKIYPEIEKKTFVLYNPCDIERIYCSRNMQSKDSYKGHLITACGRLESVKCYKNLFNAVSFARKEIQDVELVVLGDGSEMNQLQKYIVNNGMSSYITLLGFKEEPYQYVARSNLFAFSSAREGFSNVLVEALASGVPVVSTDCKYGPREILAGFYSDERLTNYYIANYGVLCPAFDENLDHQVEKEQLFANAIIKVFRDNSLSQLLIDRGIERANDFSVDKYRNKIINIFEQVDDLL